MTIPNIITIFRLSLAPVLLVLAWFELENSFLAVLIIAFITDAIDGPLARYINQESSTGSRLDSWADVSIYLVYPLGAWLLWPEIIKRELVFVVFIILSIVLPALTGLIKFHRFTNYHTWMVKIAVVSTAISSLVLFIFGLVWPFRITTVFCVIAGLEEIIITLVLDSPRRDVKSLWHVTRK